MNDYTNIGSGKCLLVGRENFMMLCIYYVLPSSTVVGAAVLPSIYIYIYIYTRRGHVTCPTRLTFCFFFNGMGVSEPLVDIYIYIYINVANPYTLVFSRHL